MKPAEEFIREFEELLADIKAGRVRSSILTDEYIARRWPDLDDDPGNLVGEWLAARIEHERARAQRAQLALLNYCEGPPQ